MNLSFIVTEIWLKYAYMLEYSNIFYNSEPLYIIHNQYSTIKGKFSSLISYYPFCPLNPIKPVYNQLNPPQWVFGKKPGFLPTLGETEENAQGKIETCDRPNQYAV